LETGKLGTVRDELALQFTVDYDDETFGFQMKKWKGVDWEYEYESA
jgi:hypothetical protein